MQQMLMRNVFWVGFFLIVLLAWWVMFSMVAAPMSMMPGQFAGLFAMWAIMMAAMMGPTFVPTMRAYEDLITSANGNRVGSIGFAAVISLAQLWLIELGLLTAMGKSMSKFFSVVLLITAGVYQFTALKDKCLAHCRSPMFQFLAHWRPGFVGGIMDLLWMGGATLLMTLEKLPDIGKYLTTPLS